MTDPKREADLTVYGPDLFGEPMVPEGISGGLGGALARRFTVPPFSVLNAREGDWQERKRAWAEAGIRGEQGRGAELINLSPACEAYTYSKGMGRSFGQDLMKGENEKFFGNPRGQAGRTDQVQPGEQWEGGNGWQGAGTSVFDPVLCEVVYQWFAPPGGSILDPFAGESTKGLVAAAMGYDYTGIELRAEQVAVNQQQAAAMNLPHPPRWLQGDAFKLAFSLEAGARFDFLWTSPPYYDLEVYSEDGADGSTKQTYEEFMGWYASIFQTAVEYVRPNRFVAVKVGEIRDPATGAYRNFVGDNIRIFTRDCGLTYYNEIIVVTAAGSLPIRVGRQFAAARKVGKTHQNILVFWKGDPRQVAKHFGGGQ